MSAKESGPWPGRDPGQWPLGLLEQTDAGMAVRRIEGQDARRAGLGRQELGLGCTDSADSVDPGRSTRIAPSTQPMPCDGAVDEADRNVDGLMMLGCGHVAVPFGEFPNDCSAGRQRLGSSGPGRHLWPELVVCLVIG